MEITSYFFDASRIDSRSERDPARCEAIQSRCYDFFAERPIDGSVRIVLSIKVYNYFGPGHFFRHRIAEPLRDDGHFETGKTGSSAFDGTAV